MNKRMKQQLASCKICQLPFYDDNTLTLEIPLYSPNASKVELEENKYYIIHLSTSVYNPPENSSLAVNWNRNVVPKSEFLLVTKTSSVGDMLQVDGCGWDNYSNKATNDVYTNLWLPRNAFKIVKELT